MKGTVVIRAIHDLHSRANTWPSDVDVAAYLNADVHDVRARLFELRRNRLFRGRRRKGRLVWMPWGES